MSSYSRPMRSSEIRSRLRTGEHAAHDTRHIHALARAIAKERLHLSERPRRRDASTDLLWDREGASYKVASRSVTSPGDATSFDVQMSADADFLLGVLLERTSYRLVDIVRIPWPTVLWLGSVRDDRVRLRWSASSAAFQVAERL